MQELLSGHDNLYRAHWGYLPTCNPEDDIAAKAAREILRQPTPDLDAAYQRQPTLFEAAD